MNACFCTLGNTKSCLSCPNRSYVFGDNWNEWKEYKLSDAFQEQLKRLYAKPKPTKRVIEKFDEKGNLTERITEEVDG